MFILIFHISIIVW